MYWKEQGKKKISKNPKKRSDILFHIDGPKPDAGD